MSSSRPMLRLAHLCAVVSYIVSSATGLAEAATPTQLAPVVTTATRTAAEPHTLGTAFETISAEDLARRQMSSLAGAIGLTAGAPMFTSGAVGGTTSIFLRGANSNQTLFLVDGMRFNDPNTDYAVFLGGSCVSACDSLEIAHGPQSTLYGGEAMGGVVALRAQRGVGTPSGRMSMEGGSFGTVQGAFSAQGAEGRNAWNLSAQGGHTDNDRTNNGFTSANATVRVDRTVNDRVSIGGTTRWFHGVYGDPGNRYTNDPDNVTREDNVLATAFTTWRLSPDWTSHFVLGGQNRRFVAESPRVGRATAITVVKNRRGVFDGQTTYTGSKRHRITLGSTLEANHTRNTGFGDINKKQSLLAVFAQDEFSPLDSLFLTAGFRNDDFDTFGRATTERGSAAWLVAQGAVKLRASYGTAFRSPSFLDLYGRSAFYQGNPELRAERARGWDAGMDFLFPQRRGKLALTWFETDYRDLIASTPNFRSVENIQRAQTRGLEATATMTSWAALEWRASYTYLEADNLTSGTRLLRRPRHRGSLDILHEFQGGIVTGVAVAFSARRRDVDARTFAQIDQEDFTVVRLYSSWQVNRHLALKARFENLLNEHYEEVNGYPALGFGGYGGLEWRW